ncbi:MAG: sensor histidine kinase, partial [Chloroflexota bacterium]|nr:sensor histidine kinase [Chloroflexota bacterium]
ELLAPFAVAAIAVSFTVNWLLLRAAFQPLVMLEDVVRQVRNGNFSIRPKTIAFPDPALQQFAETLTEMLDSVQRHRARLTSLSAALLRAQEEERKRVARDLHDDTAQSLTAVLLELKLLAPGLPSGEAQLLEQARQQVVLALEGVHRMSLNLRPPSLEEMGLVAAIESRIDELQSLGGPDVRFHHPPELQRLSDLKELALYRLVQEALTNVLKHAQAGHVIVDLQASETVVSMEVTDDGVGFDQANLEPEAGLGLFGMSERMVMVGGTLSIVSRPGQGTTISASVPLAD